MHSKHVFLFPFRWDIKYSGKEQNDTTYAERTKLSAFQEALGNRTWQETTDFKTDTPNDYNAWTYFYPFARKVIFPDSDYESYKQYTYTLGERASYQIRIVKTGCTFYDKTFILPLQSIKLNLYDLGIGILSFSIENDTYDSPEEILLINDYGRRLYPQFVGSDFNLEYTHNGFLATSIRLVNDDKSLNILSEFTHDYKQSPAYLPPHILQLLNGGKKERSVFVAEKLAKQQSGIRIEPVLDDRMFVLCWYGNILLAQELSEFTDNKYDFTKAGDDFWYRYIFVDTDLTCPDPLLKEELLKKTTYTRWAPSNTLFGVSRYTCVILTDSGGFGQFVLSVHLTTIYARLVQICLVQRAALLRFSGEVSYVSRAIKTASDLTFTSRQVQELNSSYIQFDNRYFFQEVTAQEQGIELYDLLHDRMRLTESASDVKREISELNSYVQAESSETQRVSLERISLLGGLFLIPSFLLSYFGWGILDLKHVPINNWGYGAIFIIFIILFVIGYRAFFAEPDRFISTPKTRTNVFHFVLILIASLVIVPVVGSLIVPDKSAITQPVIDSTAIRQIDSLRNEIHLLRQSMNQPTLTKPAPLTK